MELVKSDGQYHVVHLLAEDCRKLAQACKLAAADIAGLINEQAIPEHERNERTSALFETMGMAFEALALSAWVAVNARNFEFGAPRLDEIRQASIDDIIFERFKSEEQADKQD